MDFRPSPAQQLLVSTAREFLRKHCPPELVQRVALDARGFDDALWRRMAELGWSGGSLLDVILLVEEMGRAGVPGPFVTSAVAATSLLLAAGSADQHKRRLPAMAAGERIVSVALVDDGGSFDLDAIALAGEAPGRLSGRKLFVEDAHIAHELIVVTRTSRGLGLLLLPTDRPGVARLPLDTIGAEKLFEVAFDQVEVRADDRLGAGDAREALVPALQAAALSRTAEMVGGAQR